MICPTCGETMQGIGQSQFWCPRCGTQRTVTRSTATKGSEGDESYMGFTEDHYTDQVPQLVERVKAADDDKIIGICSSCSHGVTSVWHGLPVSHWADVRRCIGREA